MCSLFYFNTTKGDYPCAAGMCDLSILPETLKVCFFFFLFLYVLFAEERWRTGSREDGRACLLFLSMLVFVVLFFKIEKSNSLVGGC